MNFSSCWRRDSTRSCSIEALEGLVQTVRDVDDGVLLEDLDELLQLLELGLHPVEALEELVGTVCDVDDGVLLEDLDEFLQLLEVGLHPRLFCKGTRRAGRDCR